MCPSPSFPRTRIKCDIMEMDTCPNQEADIGPNDRPCLHLTASLSPGTEFMSVEICVTNPGVGASQDPKGVPSRLPVIVTLPQPPAQETPIPFFLGTVFLVRTCYINGIRQ